MNKFTKALFIEAAEKHFCFHQNLWNYAYFDNTPWSMIELVYSYLASNEYLSKSPLEQQILLILLVGEAENEQVH